MSEEWRIEIRKLMDRQRELETERSELRHALSRLYQRCLKELADPKDVQEMHMARLTLEDVRP